MINKLQKIWKQAVVTEFKRRHGQTKNKKINEQALPEEIQENHDKYHRTVRLLADILNLNIWFKNPRLQ
jgi:hypothetical protein